MGRYTVELNELLKDEYVKPLIDKALSSYPMYDPQSDNQEVISIIPTREVLNEKLLNHYKYREIGFETVGRFLDELEITMNEIMPYYNQMFNTVEIMALLENPFDNVDVIESFKEERSGQAKSTDKSDTKSSANDTSSTESNVNSNSKNVETSTPQNKLTISKNDIDGVDYADNVSWTRNTSSDNATTSGESSSNAESSSENNSETSETTEHTFTKKGNQGVNTYAHDMIEFRTSIIDVTMKIITDQKVRELFMMVY